MKNKYLPDAGVSKKRRSTHRRGLLHAIRSLVVRKKPLHPHEDIHHEAVDRNQPVRMPATTISVRKQVKQPAHVSSLPNEPAVHEDGSLELIDDADETPVSHAMSATVSSGLLDQPTEKKEFHLPWQSSVKKFFTSKKRPAKSTLDAVPEDDSFLRRVQTPQPAGSKDAQKHSPWGFLRMRLFTRAPKEQKKSTPLPPNIDAHDSFLQRVQQKKQTDVVGVATDQPLQSQEQIVQTSPVDAKGTSALDELANGPVVPAQAQTPERPKGRILSAKDLQKETKDANDAAARLAEEVAEMKKEMSDTQKEREKEIEKLDAKKEEQKQDAEKQGKAPHIRAQHKKINGFQQFLASLSHFGMGKERMRFIQNMATMLNAGLPLIDALRTLQLETRVKPMKKLLQKILDEVENGSPLWRAMEAQSFFSLQAIALVRIGEEAGDLAENMQYLAEQEEKDHALRSKVKMAMIYPSIVMTLMFIIVMGLGMFVLPNLIGVLYSLNVELPLVTRIVIAFSNFFSAHGIVAGPSAIGGFILLAILSKFTPLGVVTQWFLFRIPGIGKLAREATIARFGVILGGLLRAGVPVIEAMDSLVQVTPIVSYRRFYEKMRDHITVGDSFSKCFSSIRGSQKLLPPSVQQLIITGEKSGSLSEIMLKVADIYDKKASETAEKLPVILEPMLLIIIGGLVGTIAFAIIVPIYSIVGSVGRA